MLKTANAEFQSIQLWFTDQNNRPLEIYCKYYTNYWVSIIKMRYSTEPNYTVYVKGYGSWSFARRFGDKCG